MPVLILAAALLVGLQPFIARRTRPTAGSKGGQLTFWVLLAGVYGGYFSAAQGVILLGFLGLFMRTGLQEQNAVKNMLQALVNIVAAAFFVTLGGIAWQYAGLVAIGSVAGAPSVPGSPSGSRPGTSASGSSSSASAWPSSWR